MKAFGYLRVSSQGQVDGDGFARQEAAIRSYATAHDIELVRIYREEGVSGTVEVRPALADMMLSLEKNGHGVKLVIIEKLDRLARDLMVQEAIVHDLTDGGFRLESALEGADLLKKDPSRKLMRQIFGAFSEYDKSMIVEKLRAARMRIREREGRCEGRKPTSELRPELLAEVRRLRRAKPGQKRLTFAQIAERMNDDGVVGMNGQPFTAAALQSLIYRQGKRRASRPAG